MQSIYFVKQGKKYDCWLIFFQLSETDGWLHTQVHKFRLSYYGFAKVVSSLQCTWSTMKNIQNEMPLNNFVQLLTLRRPVLFWHRIINHSLLNPPWPRMALGHGSFSLLETIKLSDCMHSMKIRMNKHMLWMFSLDNHSFCCW